MPMEPIISNPSLPDLSDFSFSLPSIDASNIDTELANIVNPNIVWLVISILGIFSIIMTFVLRWHWKKYALNTKTEKKMSRIYISVLIVLFVIIIAAAVHYQSLRNL